MRDDMQFEQDPPIDRPRFASDAEIALADRLRRQLEERYLGKRQSSAEAPHSNSDLPLAA
jgi:hypothetical protein